MKEYDALMIACYMVSRSPSSALDFKKPIEIWSGKVVNYSNLKILVVLHMLMLSKVNLSVFA